MDNNNNNINENELYNENTYQNNRPRRQPSLSSRQRAENRARKISRANGTALQAAGKSAKAVGTGTKLAGKAASATGKGLNAAGQGLNKAGAALNSTGIGSLLGVPLNALGTAASVAGKGLDAGGKALDKAGDATKNAGNKLDEVGKRTKNASKKTKDNTKNLKPNLKDLKDMAKGKINKKTIIIGLILIAISFVTLFLIIIVAAEMLGLTKFLGLELGQEEENTDNTYSSVITNTNGANNSELWWPIGSSDVTTSIELDGATLEFRSGNPVSTSISAGFDDPDYPGHGAIDITAGGNIYLIAMADGVVSEITNRDNGYNSWSGSVNSCTMDGCVAITITYNNGYESRYLHLANNSIPEYLQEGDKVYQGQVVGLMGNTGCSTGQHLHLALYLNGELVDPSNYVSESNPRPVASSVTNNSEDILNNSVSGSGTTTSPSGNNVATGEFVNGSDNKQTICLTMKNYGYPDTGVAALLVNMYHESSFDPNAVNYLGCVGLVQWCFTRQTSVKSTYGNDWNLINNQLEYVQKELTSGSYDTAYNALMGSGSTADKTYTFCMKYEIPGESSCLTRQSSNLNSEFTTYVTNGCK